jgi:hypothetical protein
LSKLLNKFAGVIMARARRRTYGTPTATITLGMQTSGDDDRTAQDVLELRKLLTARCKGPYSEEISEFALVLRVGGNMQEFDFEGCQRVRRNRREKFITVDLGFPSYRWRGVIDSERRKYLADLVETGLLCCLNRLKKDKTKVSSQLMDDFTETKDSSSMPKLSISPGELQIGKVPCAKINFDSNAVN